MKILFFSNNLSNMDCHMTLSLTPSPHHDALMTLQLTPPKLRHMVYECSPIEMCYYNTWKLYILMLSLYLYAMPLSSYKLVRHNLFDKWFGWEVEICSNCDDTINNLVYFWNAGTCFVFTCFRLISVPLCLWLWDIGILGG